jgi:hypothetical protein
MVKNGTSFVLVEFRNTTHVGQVKDVNYMEKGSSPNISELILAYPEDVVMERKIQNEGTSYTCSVVI